MTPSALSASVSTLHHRQARQEAVVHKDRSTLRFFRHHPWLLRHGAYTQRQRARRAVRFARLELAWVRRELAETRRALRPPPPRPTSVAAIICSVFPDCAKALSVARCESGLSVNAANGQYLGLFQMGEYARSRYGHGPDAWTQTRAAYAYYRDSGWGPWECA